MTVAQILAAAPRSPRASDAEKQSRRSADAAMKLAEINFVADSLILENAFNLTMRNDCSIIRGYSALYQYYAPDAFPWSHVGAVLHRMRRCAEDARNCHPSRWRLEPAA